MYYNTCPHWRRTLDRTSIVTALPVCAVRKSAPATVISTARWAARGMRVTVI